MATHRMIRTAFWDDDYISSIDPMEKYFFLYLLTNTHTHICGIYQLPKKYMIFDTGLEIKHIENILEKFEKDGKIKYKDGWVMMMNWIKNQQDGMQVIKGIKKGLKSAPEWCRKYMVSIGYGYLLTSEPESESKSELESKSEEISIDIGQDEPVEEIVEEKPKKKAHGKENTDITDLLLSIKQDLNLDDFREVASDQRLRGLHLVNLREKIGEKEFARRFKMLISDSFKRPKCSSLVFIYNELKSQENKKMQKEKEDKRREESISKERQAELELQEKNKKERDFLEKLFQELPRSEISEYEKEAEENLARTGLTRDGEKKKGEGRYAQYESILHSSVLSLIRKNHGGSQ